MRTHEEVKTGTEAPEYDTPRVETEEVFESLALACTKADTQCTTMVGEAVAQS